jgi:hypothetical protein
VCLIFSWLIVILILINLTYVLLYYKMYLISMFILLCILFLFYLIFVWIDFNFIVYRRWAWAPRESGPPPWRWKWRGRGGGTWNWASKRGCQPGSQTWNQSKQPWKEGNSLAGWLIDRPLRWDHGGGLQGSHLDVSGGGSHGGKGE